MARILILSRNPSVSPWLRRFEFESFLRPRLLPRQVCCLPGPAVDFVRTDRHAHFRRLRFHAHPPVRLRKPTVHRGCGFDRDEANRKAHSCAREACGLAAAPDDSLWLLWAGICRRSVAIRHNFPCRRASIHLANECGPVLRGACPYGNFKRDIPGGRWSIRIRPFRCLPAETINTNTQQNGCILGNVLARSADGTRIVDASNLSLGEVKLD